MEKKLTGTYDLFTILMLRIKENFKLSPNTIPTDILQEYDSIKESKQKQLNEISKEPEMIQFIKESNAQSANQRRTFNTIPPEILSRKITLSMSEEFFDTWVAKAFDDLKGLHKEYINEFYKENFGVNRYS